MGFVIPASGCSDPKPPAHAWYKRNSNEAVIGCDGNSQEWRLTCSNNRWQGTVGNCSTAGIDANLSILNSIIDASGSWKNISNDHTIIDQSVDDDIDDDKSDDKHDDYNNDDVGNHDD